VSTEDPAFNSLKLICAGPDPNVVWVALCYTLTIAVTLTIIGRVSDIFGRRWVFIGGAAMGVIGSIVCATAQNINSLIGGTTIISIGAATQLSYYYVMGELVLMLNLKTQYQMINECL
jgi:MFS family permease